MASKRFKQRLAYAISTCGGLGMFPVAPGTVTSIAALLLYQAVPVLHDPWVLLPVVLLLSIAGVWSGTVVEAESGTDPSFVTIDELAGQLLALFAVPDKTSPQLLAFLFFRYFDIAKPGPVNRLQKLPGGWGIMADDLLAGIFSVIAGSILTYLARLVVPGSIF